MKSKKIIIVLSILLLLTYSVIMLLIPFTHNACFWLGFGWVIASIVMGAVASCYVLKGSNSKKSFYEIVTIKHTFAFIITIIVVSIISAVVKVVPLWLAIIVYLIITIAYIMLTYVTNLSKVSLNRVSENVKGHTIELNLLIAKVELFMKLVNDTEVKKTLVNLYDLLRYSDPMGNDNTKQLEKAILATFEEIKDCYEQGDNERVHTLCLKLENLIEKRNAICKIYK